MAEAPKKDPSEIVEWDWLTEAVRKARLDGRLTHAELTTLLDKYEKKKWEIVTWMSDSLLKEKQIADALFVESFEDMFEEYELKWSEDLNRIKRLLNIVNPLRLASGKWAIFVTKEVDEYYKIDTNSKSEKNIKLDTSTGQMRFQRFYEWWFTREGIADIKKDIQDLSAEDLKKLEKMMQSWNNLMRGSNADYYTYLSESLDSSPALANLNRIKVASLGDFHLGQLETVNGKLQTTDIDDAHMGGSAITDIARTIASIKMTSWANVDANIKAFLESLQWSLKWQQVENAVPKTMKTDWEEQGKVLGLPFVKADAKGEFSKDVKHISPSEKSSIETALGKATIDSRRGPSDGVGSSGKDKIIVTVQEGKDIKVYEFKEQDSQFLNDTFFTRHTNDERAQIAKVLWVDIRAVNIGEKSYTMKEIVPGYKWFNPDKSNPEELLWASKAVGSEIAKLLGLDPVNKERILAELGKEDVKKALTKLGTDYATRMADGLRNIKTEYPELIDSEVLEKNKQFMKTNELEFRRISGLKSVDPNNTSFDKAKIIMWEIVEAIKNSNWPKTKESVNTLHKELSSQLKLDPVIDSTKWILDDKTLKALKAMEEAFKVPAPNPAPAPAPTPAPAAAVEAARTIPQTEKFKDQIVILEQFFNKNPDLTGFTNKLFNYDNHKAFFALVEMLGVQSRWDGRHYTEDVRKGIIDTQNTLWIEIPDGAFGPKTLEMWRKSEKFGGKKVDKTTK